MQKKNTFFYMILAVFVSITTISTKAQTSAWGASKVKKTGQWGSSAGSSGTTARAASAATSRVWGASTGTVRTTPSTALATRYAQGTLKPASEFTQKPATNFTHALLAEGAPYYAFLKEKWRDKLEPDEFRYALKTLYSSNPQITKDAPKYWNTDIGISKIRELIRAHFASLFPDWDPPTNEDMMGTDGEKGIIDRLAFRKASDDFDQKFDAAGVDKTDGSLVFTDPTPSKKRYIASLEGVDTMITNCGNPILPKGVPEDEEEQEEKTEKLLGTIPPNPGNLTLKFKNNYISKASYPYGQSQSQSQSQGNNSSWMDKYMEYMMMKKVMADMEGDTKIKVKEKSGNGLQTADLAVDGLDLLVDLYTAYQVSRNNRSNGGYSYSRRRSGGTLGGFSNTWRPRRSNGSRGHQGQTEPLTRFRRNGQVDNFGFTQNGAGLGGGYGNSWGN